VKKPTAGKRIEMDLEEYEQLMAKESRSETILAEAEKIVNEAIHKIDDKVLVISARETMSARDLLFIDMKNVGTNKEFFIGRSLKTIRSVVDKFETEHEESKTAVNAVKALQKEIKSLYDLRELELETRQKLVLAEAERDFHKSFWKEPLYRRILLAIWGR
jgi:hypothetical protein